ncbi:MAG TPA: DUF6328 family protein [Actinospica sp.]|nr:DUF6328 family protein [Actinospica sp.]
MTTSDSGGGGGGDDRPVGADAEQQFTDMLQQLRVVQTGVQVLGAFLLTLPFTERFTHTDAIDKTLYVISLVSAAVSTAFVIAPVSYRQHVRAAALHNVVRVASRLAQAGMLALLIAAVCSVTLALRIAVGATWATALGATTALVYASAWYLLPAWHRLRPAARTPADHD